MSKKKAEKLLEVINGLIMQHDPLKKLKLNKYFNKMVWLVPKGLRIDNEKLNLYIKKNINNAELQKFKKIQTISSNEAVTFPLNKVKTLVYTEKGWDILTPHGKGKNIGRIIHPKEYDLYSIWFGAKNK